MHESFSRENPFWARWLFPRVEEENFDEFVELLFKAVATEHDTICLEEHPDVALAPHLVPPSTTDDIQRELYVMMSGELGSDIKTVDKNLRKVLKLVTTRKAILLIDEADFFLEKRSCQNRRTLPDRESHLVLRPVLSVPHPPGASHNLLHAAARPQLLHLFLRRTPGSRPPALTGEVLAELVRFGLDSGQGCIEDSNGVEANSNDEIGFTGVDISNIG
ncbi:hypothetical protein TruAng_008730 [Truncatella angustata]|nr:hypothetical protein TruAng_008730 [Truncatella angustata]